METKRPLRPESLMMSHGYDASASHGSVKVPVFQTSTFIFQKAEDGKAHFEVAYGLREKRPGEKEGLIYSRINNPDLEVAEKRLCLWDGAEDCALFESGMAAVTTVLLEFLKPGDLLLCSTPVYGGTEHFANEFLPKIGIDVAWFTPDMKEEEVISVLKATGKAERLAMVYVETPANPTNTLIDIAMARKVANYYATPEKRVVLAVDNTYMGPLWQHPIKFGADFVIYSATKYIGGHSDLVAGACLGRADDILRIKGLRTFLGNMAAPWTSWLILRSLETLKVRMEQQSANAQKIAHFLSLHAKVEKVYYPGLLSPENQPDQYAIFKAQHSNPGAMVSFDVVGGEAGAYRFLNSLKLVMLAVSLGSTMSLAEHPASMTHIGVKQEHKDAVGFTDKLIRLSVGVENVEDLLADLAQALQHV